MLRFDKITKIFGANTAVQSASFTVEQPMMIGIIDRPGAGKSTLLRVLNRLTDASTGEITFDGTPGQLTTGVARDIYGADASFSESATSTQIETTQVGKTMLADCAAQ